MSLVSHRIRTRLNGLLWQGLVVFASLLILAMLFVVLGIVVANGAGKINWEFISQPPREGMTAGGIFPALFGTALLVILMCVAVVPSGVITAVYLHEYAPPNSWAARLVRQATNNLAGVPSVVFGLFGVGFFIQFVGGGMDRLLYGGKLHFGQPALIWASLTLAVLTLPVVIVSTEEALRAIPADLRAGGMAVGATRWQVVRTIVLPQALPGILTGSILAIARGTGEVAPILFTGAAYFLPHLPTHLDDQFMHLGYHIYVLATQSPDVEATKPLLFGTILVLLCLTFLLNLAGIVIRTRIRGLRRLAAGGG